MSEKLEKKILEKPDDLKRHEAYVEWLRENDGNARADLIEVQIALENPKLNREKRFELELQEKRILNEHGREWIGALSEFIMMRDIPGRRFQTKPSCAIEWYRGWVYGLTLDELTLKLSKVLLQAPELRLFRKLTLIDPVNASCDYLHEWGLLDKISDLDISYGRITDKGALTLGADRSLKKLKSVDMTGNQIGEEGLAAIRKNFPKVLIDDQNPIIIKRDYAPEAEVAKVSSDEEDEE
ncbi:MAG: hypothetical protein O2983_07580 [Planctomycetota bacterium]|nr:hypothetical protein [Planctomycetota bacterium]MDA0918801.1 hypothetical protein [Planctomycetota bacterium]MDA1159456.1 hypothetical protein [Planctomycetota bacterium]